jgi:PRTRC genetic system protein E
MTTNFFNSLKDLGVQGSCTLSIANAGDNLLIVSVLFAHEKANLPPMVFKGTADELDGQFFEALKAPAGETAALFTNLDAYQKSIQEAQEKAKANAAAKTKGTTPVSIVDNAEKLEKEEKRKAYTEAVRQIVELDKACRYDEAIALLPPAEDFPEKAEEIGRRKAELERKSEQKKQLLF